MKDDAAISQPDPEMFEKYLRNEPLTPELEALSRGEEPVTGAYQSGALANRQSLTDDDREHLRRLTLEPGWLVFLRLLDDYIATQEDLAKAFSMADPLGDEKKVAQTWAYVAMYRTTQLKFMGLVADEIRRIART